MSSKVTAMNLALNQIWRKTSDQYHIYAAHHGLSDPALWALYSLCETDQPITQNELAQMWQLPKQTVNFTVSTLVQKGYLTLEQLSGARNRKALRLTEAGRAFCQQVITPLVEAEERSLLRLNEEERRLMLELNQKQCDYFVAEVQALTAPAQE